MRATETVKLHPPAYKQLRKMVLDIKRGGWALLGIDRSDTPTSATVIAVALQNLKTKLEEKNGKKE